MDWRAKTLLAVTGLALVCSTVVTFPIVFEDRWVAGDQSASEPKCVASTLRGPIWWIGQTWRQPAPEVVGEFASYGAVVSPTMRLPGVPIQKIELVHTQTPDWPAFAIQNGAILAIGGVLTLFFYYRERWQRGRRLNPPPA